MRELNTKTKRWKRSFVFQVWNNLAKGPKSRKMGLHFTKSKFLILQKKQLHLECFSYFFISTFVLLISEFFQSNPIYYFWQKTPSLVVHRVLKTPLGLTLKYWKSLEELIRITKNRLHTISWAVTRETCNKIYETWDRKTIIMYIMCFPAIVYNTRLEREKNVLHVKPKNIASKKIRKSSFNRQRKKNILPKFWKLKITPVVIFLKNLV